MATKTVTTYECDKCGKESDTGKGFAEVTLSIVTLNHVGRRPLPQITEVCGDCKREAEKFQKGLADHITKNKKSAPKKRATTKKAAAPKAAPKQKTEAKK